MVLLYVFYLGPKRVVKNIGIKIKTKFDEIYYKNTCVVCLEPLTDQSYQTHCYHQFHSACLVRWFVANMQNIPVEFIQERDAEEVYKCPLCRSFLRSDYYNNMICKPDGYQYTKSFNGTPIKAPFSVTTPTECADLCNQELLCHAYTIKYDHDEVEEVIRETICLLYQPSPNEHIGSRKKDYHQKIKHNWAKHVMFKPSRRDPRTYIRNVCRKLTDEENQSRISLHVIDIQSGSRLHSAINFIKDSLQLIKAVSLFFINILWTSIKIGFITSINYVPQLIYQSHLRIKYYPYLIIYLLAKNQGEHFIWYLVGGYGCQVLMHHMVYMFYYSSLSQDANVHKWRRNIRDSLIFFVILQFLTVKTTYVASYMNFIYLFDLFKTYQKNPDS